MRVRAVQNFYPTRPDYSGGSGSGGIIIFFNFSGRVRVIGIKESGDPTTENSCNSFIFLNSCNTFLYIFSIIF